MPTLGCSLSLLFLLFRSRFLLFYLSCIRKSHYFSNTYLPTLPHALCNDLSLTVQQQIELLRETMMREVRQLQQEKDAIAATVRDSKFEVRHCFLSSLFERTLVVSPFPL